MCGILNEQNSPKIREEDALGKKEKKRAKEKKKESQNNEKGKTKAKTMDYEKQE